QWREHAAELVAGHDVVAPPAVLHFAAEADHGVQLQPGPRVQLRDRKPSLVVEAEAGFQTKRALQDSAARARLHDVALDIRVTLLRRAEIDAGVTAVRLEGH